jgi:putative ABC transport system permease protein
MRINLAAKNLAANPKRTLVALLGVGFAVMLLFMQLGFHGSMKRGTTTLYAAFAADFVLVSKNYINLRLTDPFDSMRLVQARSVPGIARVGGVDLFFSEWKNKETEETRTAVIVSLPADPALLAHAQLRELAGAVERGRSVLLDTFSDSVATRVADGATGNVAGQDVTVAGRYQMGLALYAKVAVATAPETFQQLARTSSRQTRFGLVQLADGADPVSVREALRRRLPEDVIIIPREELIASEQDFYMEEKPVGLVFRVGVFVGFVVGSVIFFQILSTEIANKLKEFATLRALGFRDRYVYMVGVQQALLYALCGYVPCALLMSFLFAKMTAAAKMDLSMTVQLLGTVLALTLAMCGLSGWLALRRVRRADPADLF